MSSIKWSVTCKFQNILNGQLFLETTNKVDGVLVTIGIKYLHIYFSFHRLTYQCMRGRMGEGLHRFKGLHWVKDANIQVFLVAFFSACSTSTNSVCLQKNPMKDKFTYWHILPFSTELQCRHYTSWGFHMRHSLKWDHHIYIYIYMYIYIYLYVYIYIHMVFTNGGFFEVA